MSLDLQSFPTPNSDYELTELDDEVILLSVNHEKAVYLNPTAQLIWRLCDGERSVADLVEFLQERYADEEQIDQQIITALSQMVDDSVISLSTHPQK